MKAPTKSSAWSSPGALSVRHEPGYEYDNLILWNEARHVKRSAFVEAVLERFETLDFTRETAVVHTQLFTSLKRQGHSIGADNLIITATALEHGFAVMTGNITEFARIDGLQVLAI
jgi:predicted nucleic acid-binding protein